jgi:hypothetical protein
MTPRRRIFHRGFGVVAARGKWECLYVYKCLNRYKGFKCVLLVRTTNNI